MRFVALVSLALASSILAAAPMNQEEAAAKGSAVSAALLQKLGGAVKSNMQANGPVKTLEFCSLNALAMTEQIGRESGTEVSRLSLKNRNPVNAADGDDKTLLEKWERMAKNAQPLPAFELKQFPDGKTVYYKPIVINNEACLKCHGEIQNDSPLGRAIRSIYPEDKATGYRMGDLRGMIKVTIGK